MNPSILVGGIGNIFLGDDGFGVEVVRRLASRPLPPQVRLVDFGIRGFDLAYALMDDYEAVILIDAVPRGAAPGTLYTIEPDWDAVDAADSGVEMHGMNPMKVLATVKAMGGQPKRILLVGCEPSPMKDEYEERIGLSEPVERSVDQAVKTVQMLVEKLKGEQHERTMESTLDNGGNRGRDRGVAGSQALHQDQHHVIS